MPLTYFGVQERLGEIEQDLAERQNEYEAAAEDVKKLARDYELRMARTALTTKADTATEKKWRALDAIAAAEDDLYERLKNAEGKYEGLKAAVKTLEIRATIGMSLLKTMTRESREDLVRTDREPAWSGS